MEKIKITYEHLGKREFHQVIGRMRRARASFGEVGFFYRFTKAIEKGLTEMQEDYQKSVAKTFGVYDDKNELVLMEAPSEENPSRFKLKDGTREEFQRAEEEFGKKEITLDIYPVKLKAFKALGDMSVDDLVVMEPFIIPSSIEA